MSHCHAFTVPNQHKTCYGGLLIFFAQHIRNHQTCARDVVDGEYVGIIQTPAVQDYFASHMIMSREREAHSVSMVWYQPLVMLYIIGTLYFSLQYNIVLRDSKSDFSTQGPMQDHSHDLGMSVIH